MCGISGCVGSQFGIKDTLKNLKLLEYRGYDSSGLAYLENNKIRIIRAVGPLANLVEKVKDRETSGAVIGHTRWATNGAPSIVNAHPHCDARHTIALVHNGIIENFESLKSTLLKNNIRLMGQTDTEVVAQCLGTAISKLPTITPTFVLRKLRELLTIIRGTFALAFVVRGIKNKIFFAKRSSPLVIGKGENGMYLASDINALLCNCNYYYCLQDDEYGYIDLTGVNLKDKNGKHKNAEYTAMPTYREKIGLNKFDSYLQKEIAQGVESALKTIKKSRREFPLVLPKDLFGDRVDIHIVACGTALHAGRVIKFLIEHELKMPVDIDYASEFKYKEPILDKQSVCIFISQSGETADTLGCVEVAKNCGAQTIGITNVPTSRLAQMVDYCLYTHAGAEISVASTKAYMAQLSAGYGFVFFLSKILGKKISYSITDIIKLLVKYNKKKYNKDLEKFVPIVSSQKSVFFVGRGLDYFVAMEGALKLKEVCYIHCEAITAGELKHGSLALIDKNSIVIAMLTQENLIDKMLNNIHELNSRGAKVILCSPFTKLKKEVFGFVWLPMVPSILSPLFAIKPLQELTLYVAEHKGIDPDKPRNLAKSVTVE